MREGHLETARSRDGANGGSRRESGYREVPDRGSLTTVNPDRGRWVTWIPVVASSDVAQARPLRGATQFVVDQG